MYVYVYIYIYILWIPFGDHPLKLERCREDQHGPCARMTRTNREVLTIVYDVISYAMIDSHMILHTMI